MACVTDTREQTEIEETCSASKANRQRHSRFTVLHARCVDKLALGLSSHRGGREGREAMLHDEEAHTRGK